mmetsp:Transcript_38013/g.98137  ORF Transcript_38013/g.98137 Transcript_38013/m.98137 type:complete len:194 (+) Transcript_38013:247-828(+)
MPKEKAETVYTVSKESRYLCIANVGLTTTRDDLLKLVLSITADVEDLTPTNSYLLAEEYTHTYVVTCRDTNAAALLKRKLNEFYFFSSELKAFYLPRLENADDVMKKMEERRTKVMRRLASIEHEKDGYMSVRLSLSITTVAACTHTPTSMRNMRGALPLTDRHYSNFRGIVPVHRLKPVVGALLFLSSSPHH